MESRRFDPKKLDKLNNPDRLSYLDPGLIWDSVGLHSPKTIIDIGAGTGFFAFIFAGKMDRGKIYACDISDVMIEWITEHTPADIKESVVPLKMEENSLPLNDGIADLVYMINLHHELEQPVKLIVEACRLLEVGGMLAIIDWKKEETPEGPPVSIRVSEETIEHQMQGGGFGKIRKYGILPYHHFLVGEKTRYGCKT